jgi:hypothetical protein
MVGASGCVHERAPTCRGQASSKTRATSAMGPIPAIGSKRGRQAHANGAQLKPFVRLCSDLLMLLGAVFMTCSITASKAHRVRTAPRSRFLSREHRVRPGRPTLIGVSPHRRDAGPAERWSRSAGRPR